MEAANSFAPLGSTGSASGRNFESETVVAETLLQLRDPPAAWSLITESRPASLPSRLTGC